MSKPAQFTCLSNDAYETESKHSGHHEFSQKKNLQQPSEAGQSNNGPRQIKANPFAKSAADLAKKNTAAPPRHAGQDIFSDLHKGGTTSGTGQTLKRANPFATSGKPQGMKSMKNS